MVGERTKAITAPKCTCRERSLATMERNMQKLKISEQRNF